MKTVAIIIILLGLAGIPKHLRLYKYGIYADAIITAIEKRSRKSKARTYYYYLLHLKFHTENGEEVTSKLSLEKCTNAVGDTMPVLYLKNNPQKIYHGSEKASFSPFITVFIGIILAIISFAYYS
ncbi:DUF3592 domain-containing protein [Tyzzerella sp. OttesenSCG-928-J15]|nr:DUF3592 domain-containing protein [Tyzzerella sp. OttesenSCG-928-J15]